jgi:hypothetical protein
MRILVSLLQLSASAQNKFRRARDTPMIQRKHHFGRLWHGEKRENRIEKLYESGRHPLIMSSRVVHAAISCYGVCPQTRREANWPGANYWRRAVLSAGPWLTLGTHIAHVQPVGNQGHTQKKQRERQVLVHTYVLLQKTSSACRLRALCAEGGGSTLASKESKSMTLCHYCCVLPMLVAAAAGPTNFLVERERGSSLVSYSAAASRANAFKGCK